MAGRYVCAVDVGTGSARAAIFDIGGTMFGRGEHPIQLHGPEAGYAEHDSEDIWSAVRTAVRGAVAGAGVAAREVAGIGFDATCSLVVRARDGGQVSVSPTGENRWDTMAWLDHRAMDEAEECTSSRHEVLDCVGGVMSPEMQTPKLMWLKRNRQESWERAGYFADLADFLTFRATGSAARSQCTLTSKWTYLAHEEEGWRHDFFGSLGLVDMLARGGLPERPTPVGADLGPLTAEAAADLGLTVACRVASGMIDAHAGALGMLGYLAADPAALDRNAALIAGTSSCVMAMTHERRAFPGGWGPYFGATMPGLWAGEGGQSAAGALLDHVIRWHSAGGMPTAQRHREIAERVTQLRAEDPDLAARLHVLPDFHGNRSPLADPHALGVISGLSLDVSYDSLCRLYWRTSVGIVLGVRQILETLNAGGFGIDTLHIAGGHTKNPLLMELYADALGCTLIEPVAEEAVLAGTAMAAAAAARLHADLATACAAMCRRGRSRRPNPAARTGLDRDYRILREMQRQRASLEAIL